MRQAAPVPQDVIKQVEEANPEFSSNSYNEDELQELEPREPSWSNVEEANKDGQTRKLTFKTNQE